MAILSNNDLDLRLIKNGLPGITLNFGGVLVEAASICLEDQNHQLGAILYVYYKNEKNFMPLLETLLGCINIL